MRKLCIGIVLWSCVKGFSQDPSVAWGDYFFFNQNYAKAIDFYVPVRDRLALAAQQNLAQSYLALGDEKEARQLFNEIVNNPMADIQDYFRYAQLLKDNPKLAEEYRDKAAQLPIPFQSLWAEDSLLYKKRFRELRYEALHPLALNTQEAEFAATLIPGGSASQQLLYVTSRKMEGEKKRLRRILSKHPVYNLAQATIDSSQTTGSVSLLQLGLNTVLQDGPVAYDPETKTLYMTRSATLRDEQGVIHLELVQSDYPKKENKVPTVLSLNVAGYSTLHPSFDLKGQRLFFASDRPGGFGGYDLYVAQRLPDGRFEAPINLGKDVNTEADEVFPNWVMGQLSYASNSKEGIGGLDIWLAEEVMINRWVKTILGAPYNTIADDFGWILNKAFGLQSSSREGGQGDDDLYAFEATPDLTGVADEYDYFASDTLVVSALGVHHNDEALMRQQNPLHRFFRRSYELATAPQGSLKWNRNGSFLYFNPVLESTRDSFTYQIQTDYGKSDPILVLLHQKNKPISGLSKEIQTTFEPIFFNYDRADLLTQYKDRLDRVVNALKQYPKMVVRVNSYTDSRGPETYNLELSKNRHQTMIRYIDKALNQTGRVVGVAFGESKVPENNRKDYVLYGGSYGAKKFALERNEKFIQAGEASIIEKAPNGLFRVLVGTYESYQEANAARERLQSETGIVLWIDQSPVNKKPDGFHSKQRRVEFEVLNY
ncbi:MAG: OmpA family protein [Flavobacteriaceae bacterium]